MKKLLSIVLVAMMALTALAGCAAPAASQASASNATAADATAADAAAQPAASGETIKVGILGPHTGDYAAYGLAAAACIGLIATYLSGALGGLRPGLAFGAGLTGLYGVLYGVLLSEDNSLLMGSVLLFAALGTVMLATRRLNWYGLGRQLAEATPATPAE